MNEESSPPKPELTGPPKPAVPQLRALQDDPAPPPEVKHCPTCSATLATELTFCTSCGEKMGPDPLVDKVLDGRYQVVRLLGAGAMGQVYEVKHLRLGKRFAMKVIHRELTQIPEFVARFEREALSMSRLQHPNCITVTDFGHAATGELYLVMEFLEGQSLAEYLERPLPVGTALEITQQILKGVGHAHRAGVIHRDLKPENVMRLATLDGSWQVKVVDFGIAKLPVSGSSDKEPLTKAGVVFGTPQYMAPEQALGGEVTERADVYAVGVILWRLLTGRRLFEIDGHVEVLSAKLSQPAPELETAAPGVFSAGMQDLLRRALARKPSERLASAEEMIRLVEQIQQESGGGLASKSPALKPQQVLALIKRVPTTLRLAYGSWYGQSASPPPTWRARATALVTTRDGTVVLGSALGALIVLLLSLSLFLGSSPESPPTGGSLLRLPTRADRSDKKAPIAAVPKPAAVLRPLTNNQRRMERARQFLAQGACREASIELQNLLREEPQNATGHYLHGAVLLCRKQYTEGLASYTRAMALNEEYRKDARILEDAERLLRVTKMRRATLEFLGRQVGQPALALLTRLASSHGVQEVRRYAQSHVSKLGGGGIDWLTALTLDLRQGSSCKERGRAVAGLRQLGDPRAIPALRQARDERVGFLFRNYKNWCIRKQIVAALKDLAGKPTR